MKSISRVIFPLIAVIGLACAVAGLWFDGLRNETEIAATMRQLPRSNETPFFRCADSFYWVSYAREMIDTGKLRVRFTQMDNAPYGRPNSAWASLNAWYLVALAKLWSVITATPLREALLPAALWASPLLYFLTLGAVLGVGWFTGNFRSAAAAVLVWGTAPRVYADFAYAVPGHHGWHDVSCFAMLACLATAIRRGNAKLLFATAGFAGAVAIWIGATQQIFGLAAAGVGAIAGLFVCAFTKNKTQEDMAAGKTEDFPAAECWRVFGVSGAISAILFYLIEYAPGPFAMRLEVNHPIYAFAFVVGGEFLCRLQRLILSAEKRATGDMFIAAISGLVLASFAIAIFFGPAEWHIMRQPFMQRLHQEIAEFQSITVSNRGECMLIWGAPFLLVVTAIFRAVGRERESRERMALLVCACPCAVALGLSFVQVRWAGIAGACAAALAAILFADFKNIKRADFAPNAGEQTRWQLSGARFAPAACLCLSLGFAVLWDSRRTDDNSSVVRKEVVDRLATMQIARVLQNDATATRPIAIFSDQKIRQAWIGYADGVRGVGSLYWDSPTGIRDEAEFLATYNDQMAHRIARARGVKYVITTPNGGSVIAYHYMWQGEKDSPAVRKTLAYRLAAPHPTPPSWLQLLPVSTGAIAAEGVRIYRVL